MIPVVKFRIVDMDNVYLLSMDIDYRRVAGAEFTTREQAEAAEWAMRQAYAAGLKTGLDVGMALADRRES